MTKHQFERITIIGLGLIGSSIARSVRERNMVGTIVAFDHNEVSLAFGRKHHFIDIAAETMAASVDNSDLVIIATPPSILGDVAAAIAPALKPGCIVMDVCSVKEPAITAIAPHMPKGVHFIPAHPIAGSEQSGVAAGRSDMFAHKRVIVAPKEEQLQETALQQVNHFWKAMDAHVEAMPAHLHDLVYAYVSHLPQLLAFAAGNVLATEVKSEDPLLQKFLRLSHSNTDMWIEIFLLNKDNVITALNRYIDAVNHIKQELSEGPEEISPPPVGGMVREGALSASSPILPPPWPSPLQGEGVERLARTALFPRVAASCLITTVMEAEKKAGFPFARYAGTGFADFSYPASQPPEGDIESIANQYQAVGAILGDYIDRLKAFSSAINSGDIEGKESLFIAS